MKAFVKGTSTLLLALVFLLGVFFLPSEQFESVKRSLDFLSKTENAAFDFGYYMAQRVVNTAIFLGATILIAVAAKRAYENRGK